MTINTGGRTDTVHYYSKWLLKRFEEGYVLSRNSAKFNVWRNPVVTEHFHAAFNISRQVN